MSNSTNTETKVMRLRYAADEAFVAESQSGHAIVTSFAHDKVTAPTPMELLLIALGGCTGADVISILQKKRLRVTAYEIEVRGERRAEHPRKLSETKYCSVSAMLAVAAKITSRYEITEEEQPAEIECGTVSIGKP